MILLVGVTTCISGVILVLRHLHVWRRQLNSIDEQDQPRIRKVYTRQMRRRVLTSSCIAVLGFIIALLHFTEYWRDQPSGHAGYVILVWCSLVLIFMIFVLASLDFLTVSHFVRSQRVGTREAAEELAREYHRLHKKRSGNDSEASAPTDPNES